MTAEDPSVEPTPTGDAEDTNATTGVATVDPVAALKLALKALEALPLLAPFALLAGWLTVAFYARSLGVQPGDLGLGITELLVLATINLILGLMLAVGMWRLHGAGRRRRAVGAALVAVAGVFIYSSPSWNGALIGCLVAFAAYAMSWISRRRDHHTSPTRPQTEMTVREFVSGLGGLSLVPVAMLSLQLLAAHTGGAALRDGNPSDLPVALALVLPADEGMLEDACVVRIAPRVFIRPGDPVSVVILSEIPAKFIIGCATND